MPSLARMAPDSDAGPSAQIAAQSRTPQRASGSCPTVPARRQTPGPRAAPSPRAESPTSVSPAWANTGFSRRHSESDAAGGGKR